MTPFACFLALGVVDPSYGVFTEISGGGYARQAINLVPDGRGGVVAVADAVFPTATADWPPYSGYGIFDAATGGALLMWWDVWSGQGAKLHRQGRVLTIPAAHVEFGGAPFATKHGTLIDSTRTLTLLKGGLVVGAAQALAPPSAPTLVDLTLSTTTFSNAIAPGGKLADISGASLGAKVTIAPADASRYFAVSSDGKALLAGLAFPTLSLGAAPSVQLTETPSVGSPRNTTAAATITGVVVAAPTLATLALSANTATQNAAFTATISGATSGSAVVATSSDGATLTVSGSALTGTFATSGAKTITLTETLAGATGSPKTSTATVTVAAAGGATLAALTLSTGAATQNAAFSATINGRTAGSTIAASSSDGTAMTVSGGAVSGTFTTTGAKTVTLVETLAGATGSPRTSTATVTVAASGGATLAALTLSPAYAAQNSAYAGTIANATAGSTVTATSSDGATLTVSGSALTGTFATSGAKTITLTETLAGATGSPKTTTVTLTVVAALASPRPLLVIGDSIMAGRGTGTDGAGMAGARALSFPTKTRDALIALGVPSSSASFEEANNTGGTLPTYDPRVTLGGWAVAGGTSIGGHLLSKASATANPLTFTPSVPVDTFEIYTPTNSYGSITAVVDSGAAQTISETGTSAYTKTTITVAKGVHTLSIDTPSSTLAYLNHVVAYDSTAKEVRVINMGVRTWSTTDWIVADQPWRALTGIPAYSQVDTGIMLGVNDLRTGGPGNTAATFESQLTTIVNKALTAGTCFLMIPTPINTTQEGSFTQAQLATSIQNVATAKSVSVFDARAAINEVYGTATWAGLNALGLTYDDLHLSAGPYDAVARAPTYGLAKFLKTRAGL